MNGGFLSRGGGEFEAEIALPFMVGYRVDSAGEIEVTGIVAAGDFLPESVRIAFEDLPPRRGSRLAPGQGAPLLFKQPF
jgi:hypothetical protein